MALQKSKVMIAIDICFVKENCLHPFQRTKELPLPATKMKVLCEFYEHFQYFHIFNPDYHIRLKLVDENEKSGEKIRIKESLHFI